MEIKTKIVAEIKPVPLGRTQINTNNHGRYLPKRSQEFKEKLSWIARAAMAEKVPLVSPLRVTTHFFKKYKNLEDLAYRNTGDVDNFVKAVFDACNKIVWEDDRQIIEVHAFKHNSEQERIEIEMEQAELKNCNANTTSIAFLINSVARLNNKSVIEILNEVTEMLKQSA